LAIRGGLKAARNGAIMCAIFLAVIEGVGIGFQRVMADQTRLDVSDILIWACGIQYTDSHHIGSSSSAASARVGGNARVTRDDYGSAFHLAVRRAFSFGVLSTLLRNLYACPAFGLHGCNILPCEGDRTRLYA
jgi:hypothetical protein